MDAIANARGIYQIHRRALAYTEGKNLNWELLIWDRTRRELMSLDNNGSRFELGPVATIGSGGDLAQGYLDGCKKPSSVAQAVKQARGALDVAYRRNAACGGAQRFVVATRRKIEIV